MACHYSASVSEKGDFHSASRGSGWHKHTSIDLALYFLKVSVKNLAAWTLILEVASSFYMLLLHLPLLIRMEQQRREQQDINKGVAIDPTSILIVRLERT